MAASCLLRWRTSVTGVNKLYRMKKMTYCNKKYNYTTKHESEPTTHFGFKTVTEEEKEHKVYEVFHNVAESYDKMNDVMSVGVHRLWKDCFMEIMGPTSGTQLLDVAGGTGDIAFRFLQYIQNDPDNKETFCDNVIDSNLDNDSYSTGQDEQQAESDINVHKVNNQTKESNVTVCDITQAMLEVGKAKSEKMCYNRGISWVRGNAESLPFPDNSFDVYTVAFGIRNMTHIDKVLSEAFRVLRRGGRFMCLEFSEVRNPAFRKIYDEYSFQVIPVMGKVVAGDWESYQYLVESIRKFPNQKAFAGLIRQAGFTAVGHENLMGGIAAIHSGFKL